MVRMATRISICFDSYDQACIARSADAFTVGLLLRSHAKVNRQTLQIMCCTDLQMS